jgi:hypothetical protein
LWAGEQVQFRLPANLLFQDEVNASLPTNILKELPRIDDESGTLERVHADQLQRS